jgi:single-strand DNA-binding protein
MNKVIELGRLGKDVELRYTQSGKAFATFSLAVDDGFGENKKTYWLSVVVWDKLAERCANSLHKGSKVLVEGKLTTRTTEKDGKKSTFWDIVAFGVEFLDPKGQQSQGQAAPADDMDIPF